MSTTYTNVGSTVDVVATSSSAGGLLGWSSKDTVTNSSASGTVSGEGLGVNALGGVVGLVQYDSEGSSSFDTVTATGAVTGNNLVGGFVGQALKASFTNTTASGHVTGTDYVGGFAGGSYCESYHNYSHAEGAVTASGSVVGGYAGDDGCEGLGSTYEHVYATGNVSGVSQVGGFMGITGSTTLDKTFGSGNVQATDGFAGGLVGQVRYGSTIDESAAFGDVTSATGPTGGLVGDVEQNGSAITNSFARGNVSADTNVGGLLGTGPYDITFDYNYATGHLTATGVPLGGLIANKPAAEYTNTSFWDTETSGTDVSSIGAGKTTAQMKDEATFTTELGFSGWDFQGIWQIDSGVNDGYPCLQWMSEACSLGNIYSQTDYNDDGIPDSHQLNVSILTNSATGSRTVLETNCERHNGAHVATDQNGQSDAFYKYPLGLVGFTAIGCEPGASVTVKLFFYGDYDASKFQARKWWDGHGYSTIPNAQLTNVTVDGEPVLKITYQVVDGGALDQDGQVNGEVTDPAGPGEAIVQAPNTGLGGRS